MDTTDKNIPELRAEDRAFIHEASRFFHEPGSMVKGMNWFGGQLERGTKLLPKRAQAQIAKVVQYSLRKALVAAFATVSRAPKGGELTEARAGARKKADLHTLATALTGGISGYFGLPAVLLELPMSTVLMLRSIVEVARECGEDLRDPASLLECLVVFSLGNADGGELEIAYYETRASVAAFVRTAAAYVSMTQSSVVLRELEKGSAPAVVNLIAKVASIFQIRVTKKILVQATPVIGAAGGAAVNAAFANFYGRAAFFHFGLRQLERKYGEAAVRAAFDAYPN